jgi:Na+/glutamate symporter
MPRMVGTSPAFEGSRQDQGLVSANDVAVASATYASVLGPAY